MRKITIGLLAVVAAAASSFIIPKGPGATLYKVDVSKSNLKWTGKKVTGEHTGDIKISSGGLKLEGKKISEGSFEIDVNSITCTDIADKDYNAKLINHLKGEDFFSTAKFPKASFVLTKAVPKGNDQYDVTGNLTIKGITHPVTFPATVKSEGNKITAKSHIVIDRTKYDIKYKSASFFENLGDKAIENDFALDLDLVANQ